MQSLESYVAIDEHEELGSISQTQYQFGNPSITITRITDEDNKADLPVGTVIVTEDMGSDTNQYALTADEVATAQADITQYLYSWANDCARNTDDYLLECLRWGTQTGTENEVAEDYQGQCVIVREGSYYGYTPYDYVCEDEPSAEVKVFESRAAAQQWIDDTRQQTYHLSHNEADRPTYYIVEW